MRDRVKCQSAGILGRSVAVKVCGIAVGDFMANHAEQQGHGEYGYS
jgi:hypothetical protein